MPSAQSLGDIFLGVSPGPARSYMKLALAAARERYDRLVVPCTGRFAIPEVAVDAGWSPEQIEASDISLFSTIIGTTAAGGDLSQLRIKFQGEFADLQPHVTPDVVGGAALFVLKCCQLREDKYFERQVRDTLIRNKEAFIVQLQESIDKLAKKLEGIKYAPRDLVEHAMSVKYDPRTVLHLNPPGFAKGYTKMFDTKGNLSWDEPSLPEFDSATLRPKLYQALIDEPAPALAYFFRSKEVEPGYEHAAVFAAESGRTDYILCNRPNEADKLVKRRPFMRMVKTKYPLLPDDYEITLDSEIQMVEIGKSQALYYRDLFAHKLGSSKAERYFGMLIDGYFMASTGFFFSEVNRGMSDRVFEVYGFTAPNARYPRLNRLFMSALMCGSTRDYFNTLFRNSLYQTGTFQTSCVSTTPEQKTHRGLSELIKRELRDDGRFLLVYQTPFHLTDYRQTIGNWLHRMLGVEKETGKSMGLSPAQQEIARAWKPVPVLPKPAKPAKGGK